MTSMLRKETPGGAAPQTEQLRHIALFSLLRSRELRVLESRLHQRNYLAGEVIFDEGEEGQALYIVSKGKVLICQQGEPDTGRIAEVSAGGMFGELALLDGSPRSAQARAAEDCVLSALSRAEFNALLETHAVIASKISLQLAREMANKLRGKYVTIDQRML